MPRFHKPKGTFTYDEVQSLIQTIYGEFAELPTEQKTTWNLRNIIEIEVEKHPFQPVRIFTPESSRPFGYLLRLVEKQRKVERQTIANELDEIIADAMNGKKLAAVEHWIEKEQTAE
jgi:hypothetical protein